MITAALTGAASELRSFDVSSINWLNDSVFLNVPKFLMKLGQITKDCGIKPELVSLLSYDQSGRLYMAKDVPTNNVLQVKRAVELVNLANRSVATTAEARVFLNFPINTGSKLP